MGINALIGKQEKDGKVTYIYCHDDSSPSDAGKILTDSYLTIESVDKLIGNGNTTSLVADTQKRPSHVNWCRENGKQHYKPEMEAASATIGDFTEIAVEDVQYAYLFADGEWKYMNTCKRSPKFRKIIPQTMYGLGNLKHCNNLIIAKKGAEIASSSAFKRR